MTHPSLTVLHDHPLPPSELSMRCRQMLSLFLIALAPACRDCDDLGNAVPDGAIEPAVYDFGPITTGSECTAQLEVTNVAGRTDLAVESAQLVNTTGTWRTLNFPPLVRLGGRETLEVLYTANGNVGEVQSATLELLTDDPDNGGVLRAALRALVTDAPAPTIKTECDADGTTASPCAAIDFGAQLINGAGKIVPVTVRNDGTADLEVSFAAIQNGDAAFEVISVRRGSAVVELPVVVPPGRSGACGESSGQDNAITIDVRYAPTTTGANADTLVILTNAVNDPDVEVALAGVGGDIGIVMTPDRIDFSDLPEGETSSVDVAVLNIGTREARVDQSCIDIENDDVCDARCTGQPADAALNGTLTCSVSTTDGSRESLGFILAPTDARAGGDDERIITVTWAPAPGAATIPPTAVLALHSAILNDKIFTAPLVGGSIGVLDASIVSEDECPASSGRAYCIEASGDPDDFTTWTGDITIRLTNVGRASLTISSIEFDGPPTINDDYTLTPPANLTLAPNAFVDMTISYDETGAGADAAASSQATNILVRHTGAGAVTTIPLDIVRPE